MYCFPLQKSSPFGQFVCDPNHNVCCVSSVLQLISMESESEVLMKEYSKMMTDMIVLCATLALSLFFWIVSVTISAYSGEP